MSQRKIDSFFNVKDANKRKRDTTSGDEPVRVDERETLPNCLLLCQSVFAIFSNEFLPCSQGFIIVCNRMRNMLRKKAQYLSHSITVFLFIIVSISICDIFQ